MKAKSMGIMFLLVLLAIPAWAKGNQEVVNENGNKQYVIGLSQAAMNHPHRVAMAQGNVDYAKKNLDDVTVILTNAQNNATKQVSDVEDLVARGIDLLIISPLQQRH